MPVRLPGFVNAHVHLEWSARETGAGLGLPAWVKSLRGGAPPSPAAAVANARAARDAGTAAVVDIGNTNAGKLAMSVVELDGYALDEGVGIDQPDLADLERFPHPTPHSTYASHRRFIQAASERAFSLGYPLSIHCDEDPDEHLYLRDASGVFADYARALGRNMAEFDPPGCTPIPYLERLGVLGTHTLLVHCTITNDADLDIVARHGAAIVVCPASNLHITGKLPNVEGMVRRNIPVLVGTDSLASTPSLDLVDQVRLLRAHFPAISLDYWVESLTTRAASVLGLTDLGEVEWAAESVEAVFAGNAFAGEDRHRRWLRRPYAEKIEEQRV